MNRLAELILGIERRSAGYSPALQAARVRASYQRAYFAPALFNLIPVKTDLIASMAVDSRWRLYYNDAWLAAHTVEENAAVLLHEVSHLLRDHEARKQAAAVNDLTLWNTATDCEINDDSWQRACPCARSSAARQIDWRAETRRDTETAAGAAASGKATRESRQSAEDCGSRTAAILGAARR